MLCERAHSAFPSRFGAPRRRARRFSCFTSRLAVRRRNHFLASRRCAPLARTASRFTRISRRSRRTATVLTRTRTSRASGLRGSIRAAEATGKRHTGGRYRRCTTMGSSPSRIVESRSMESFGTRASRMRPRALRRIRRFLRITLKRRFVRLSPSCGVTVRFPSS